MSFVSRKAGIQLDANRSSFALYFKILFFSPLLFNRQWPTNKPKCSSPLLVFRFYPLCVYVCVLYIFFVVFFPFSSPLFFGYNSMSSNSTSIKTHLRCRLVAAADDVGWQTAAFDGRLADGAESNFLSCLHAKKTDVALGRRDILRLELNTKKASATQDR